MATEKVNEIKKDLINVAEKIGSLQFKDIKSDPKGGILAQIASLALAYTEPEPKKPSVKKAKTK